MYECILLLTQIFLTPTTLYPSKNHFYWSDRSVLRSIILPYLFWLIRVVFSPKIATSKTQLAWASTWL